MSDGNFILVGNLRLAVDMTVWYQPVTVKLCFSLILICSVTSCQCLQQRLFMVSTVWIDWILCT